MRSLSSLLLGGLFGAAHVLGGPIARSTAPCASQPGDAPYTLPCAALAATVTFPDGFHRRPGGIVFLVHGTASTGEETWGPGPYRKFLPGHGPGYDIAWFTSPTRSLGDAQLNAEYVAYNLRALAQQSATGKVFVISHSQGGINTQWALAFWPSMRALVAGFVSLAGDFHGTGEGPLLCTGQDLLQGGCEPGVLQQNVGSHYLAAQNARGGAALVGTTSLYTLEDDIVQPEILAPTSALPGAAVFSVQQACPLIVTDHFGMTITAPAFFVALDALAHGGVASLSRFNAPADCNFAQFGEAGNPFVEVPGAIRQASLDALAVGLYAPKVLAEPKLMPYVCESGAVRSYCST